MLLEHIKRYDNDKIVKFVSIDDIRTVNANIINKIPSVPALMIMPSKEILFGKNVFDYLLLPPRGILCKNSIKTDKKSLDTTVLSGISQGTQGMPKLNNFEKSSDNNIDEPFSFTLNRSSIYSDNFSSIEDESLINNDRNYKWNLISEENDDVKSSSINGIKMQEYHTDTNEEEKSAKKQGLPSIEDLMLQRDKDIMLK
jgi:hypothetical protein